MKYVSLFAGIGGFDLALNRLGHECVYVNEWDKYAAQTYEKNFGHKPDTRSITDVPAGDIPDHDLLVGGFPCQSFSVAGLRHGFSDTRGTMFFEIARIAEHKRPAYLLLENVKGLLSHDNNRTFKTILRALDELGYDFQWQVCNSKNFGVPQNRERVFIVGHLRGKPRPKVFPIGDVDSLPEKKIRAEQGRPQAEVSHTLKGSNNKADNVFIVHNLYGGFGETEPRIFENISPTIRTPKGGGHIPSVVQGGVRMRKLTPIECERLQGFPDNWTKGVVDSQRYKQLGNAVTVNVVEEIARRAFAT